MTENHGKPETPGSTGDLTDPQLWLPLIVLAIGIGVLALVK